MMNCLSDISVKHDCFLLECHDVFCLVVTMLPCNIKDIYTQTFGVIKFDGVVCDRNVACDLACFVVKVKVIHF